MQLIHSAARVLQRVIDDGRSLDQAFDEVLPGLEGSSSALKELGFGGCRYYTSIDSILGDLLDKPIRKKDRIVHFILVAAIYQLEHMDVPDHAVVNEAVKSLENSRQSWARKFVNGVLRNFLRGSNGITLDARQEYVQYSIPEFLFSAIKSDWPDHYTKIANASNQRPPLTLRVNRQRLSRADYCSVLDQLNVDYQVTADSDTGITLLKPTPVSEIPGFSEGQVSVQDESAQLVVKELALQPGQRVLDGCAAPGGKTGLILEAAPGSLQLVAVDLAARTPRIRENLERLDLSATVIDADLRDSQWWDGQSFHRILLDVPCSGTGVLRRHPDIRHRRKPGDIERFAQQQTEILRSVWPMLDPGGLLLYVTCSILRKENDEAIENFIGELDDYELQSIDQVSGLKTRYGRQRLPGVNHGDGFYFCSIRKTG